MVSEGHCTVSPQKVRSFGTLGGPNTFGNASTSKAAGKVLLGYRPDSPGGSNMEVAPAGLRISQLKMDMPPIFTANRQQNVRGWLMKMERYFKLMDYPADIWIEVVATHLIKAAKAVFNGESQRIETRVDVVEGHGQNFGKR